MDLSMYRDFAEVHEDRHWWFVGRRRIVRSLLESLLGPGRDRTLLEIGCGTGGMLPVLSEFCRVTGVDPSQGAIRYSRQRHRPHAELLRAHFPRELPPRRGSRSLARLHALGHLAPHA